LATHRPYPDLRSNLLKLFADFQVVIVVLVGLVLRIEPDAFADEAASQAFYGDAMLVLMLLTLVPVVIALFYRSDQERSVMLLQEAALVEDGSNSDLAIRRRALRTMPPVLVVMKDPQPWGLDVKEKKNITNKMKRVVVSGVEPGSAADQAGISPGMVLRSVAGARVYDSTTATKLAASAAVPVLLGFDTTNAGALRNQAGAAEPEPELDVEDPPSGVGVSPEPEQEPELEPELEPEPQCEPPPTGSKMGTSNEGQEQEEKDVILLPEPSGDKQGYTTISRATTEDVEDASLLRELQMLKMRDLRKRAVSMGVAMEEVEEARDSENPKKNMISLIVARAAAAAGSHTGARP
jgi:hypothetical protein